MTLTQLKLLLLIFSLLTFTAGLAQAKSKFKGDLHLRSGYLGGKYDGQFSGSFDVPAAADMDYEILYHPRMSAYFRFTMAMDNPESRPFYTYSGVGHRFYFDSRSRPFWSEADQVMISIDPIWRFYVAVELGVAQVITKTFGAVIQSVSNMTELGLNTGAIYKVTRRFGLEAQLGGTVGYGFTSVAATGTTVRFLVGANYNF